MQPKTVLTKLIESAKKGTFENYTEETPGKFVSYLMGDVLHTITKNELTVGSGNCAFSVRSPEVGILFDLIEKMMYNK